MKEYIMFMYWKTHYCKDNCLQIDRFSIILVKNLSWFYVCVKIDKLIVKFIWKNKGLRAKTILKKTHTDRGFYMTVAYYKAMGRKTVGYCSKEK